MRTAQVKYNVVRAAYSYIHSRHEVRRFVLAKLTVSQFAEAIKVMEESFSNHCFIEEVPPLRPFAPVSVERAPMNTRLKFPLINGKAHRSCFVYHGYKTLVTLCEFLMFANGRFIFENINAPGEVYTLTWSQLKKQFEPLGLRRDSPF